MAKKLISDPEAILLPIIEILNDKSSNNNALNYARGIMKIIENINNVTPTSSSLQPPQPVRLATPDEIIVRRLLNARTLNLNENERINIINTYLVYKQKGEDNLTAFTHSLKGSSLTDTEKANIIIQFMPPKSPPKPIKRRFPPSDDPVRNGIHPSYLKNTGEKNLFYSLDDNLKKQLLFLEKITKFALNQNEQYKIFSEFNNLANSKYNSNSSDLEFEQVHILRNILAQSSSLSPVQKHDILFKFANTLNDEYNFTYCQELAKSFLKGIN